MSCSKIAAVESLEARQLLSAGNILVSGSGFDNANVLYEYSSAGKLLSTINVAVPASGYDQPHDLAVDAAGRVQLFYGGNHLATYAGGGWSFHSALNWSLFGVTTAGGLAAYQNFVYCQSQQDNGPDNGIVRFNVDKKSYPGQLFQIPDGSGGIRQPLDVTLGNDNLLYVTCYNSYPANTVVALDPITMNVVKTIALDGNHNGAFSVADAAGDIYTLGDGYLNKYAADGTFLKSVVDGGVDIDIAPDGTILTNNDDNAVIYDQNLNVTGSFAVNGAYWGQPFVTWDRYEAAPGPANVSGSIFNDRDGNGIKGRHEKPLAGVTVFADANGDGMLDAGEKSAVTDANGTFQIAGVPAGSYKLRQILPAGFRQTTPLKHTYLSIALAGSDQSGFVFGDTSLPVPAKATAATAAAASPFALTPAARITLPAASPAVASPQASGESLLLRSTTLPVFAG